MASPLEKAAKRGDLVAARSLLKAGADPNEGRRGISFPLWAAAHRGNTPRVTLLLEAGAKPTWHVVYAAAYKNHANTLRMLLAAGAPTDSPGATAPLLNGLKDSGFPPEQQSKVRQLLRDSGARELPAWMVSLKVYCQPPLGAKRKAESKFRVPAAPGRATVPVS